MPDRPLKMRVLQQRLREFGIEFDARKGKGSHGSFIKPGFRSFPVPRSDDVLRQYITQIRRRFNLTEADGVSDKRFYGDQ